MHPLDGPRTKFERAKSQLITLQNVAQRFFEVNRYTVVLAEFDRKTSRQSVRVNDCPTIPDEWGVIIGEIAHDLRSALDLLVWQLALQNTPKPSDKTAFPIYTIGKSNRRTGSGDPIRQFWHKTHGLKLIGSIHRRYIKRIESFQPYKGRNKSRHNPLFLLQQLNNTDKHRLITVINPSIAQFTFNGLIGGGSEPYKSVTLRPKAKVGFVMPLSSPVPTLDITPNGDVRGIRYQKEIIFNSDLTPGIRFGNGCNAVKGLPVIGVLRNILKEVSDIIESFAKDF